MSRIEPGLEVEPLKPAPGLWVRPFTAGMYPEGVILYVIHRWGSCFVQCEAHDTAHLFVAESAHLDVIPAEPKSGR